MKKFTNILSGIALLACHAFAAAELTIVTLSGVGSQSDTALRYLQPVLQTRLGEQVNIVNVPGGNGVLGMRAAAERPAESTLLVGSVYLSVSELGADEAARQLSAQFIPVSGLTHSRQLILVPSESKLRSLADLRGKKLNGGSAFISNDFIISQLDAGLGSHTTVVRYRQGSQMVVDALDGRLDYILSGSGNSATEGFITAGRLRPLAVVGDLPLSTLSTLPLQIQIQTTAGAGLKGIRDFGWAALFAGQGMSTARQIELRDAFRYVLSSPYGQAYGQRPGAPIILNIEPKALLELKLADTAVLRKMNLVK